ncbi:MULTISPECIES: helix-turn-helix domain-containing protein [unclassified Enterococcus]|uniref:helix-turn-helix domain-containing protein n=1 Tax=unclassified Enterococcus TaxID=2608891 RepID=UPI001CE04AB8|nr:MULTISPECIES: helix-turn-helix domain-containing protein [unclassified Enterococcus]MCA5012471.1 helix-turn-helix domain-containing protein [Enterococcus sp. S23]MCA5015722.1 helix-turn-helix domain-containing protein [Enterococcus sp. S22(2020)]
MTPDMLNHLLNEIEEHLTVDLTAEELAKKSGYSVYYFYRLFSLNIGKSFSAYQLDRRLKKVLQAAQQGQTFSSASALYGFDTYAGFYKAFIKEYGCSPRKYLAIHKNEIKNIELLEVTFMRLNTREIKELLKNWPIDPTLKINNVSPVQSFNHTKNVWAIGEEYFLHQTTDRSGELKNIAIAEALQKQNFASSLPIPTRNGQLFIENDSLILLKKGIDGAALSLKDILSSRSKQYALAYGQAIARLHQAFLALDTQILCDTSDLFSLLKTWAVPNVKKQAQQWNLAIPNDFFDNYLVAFEQFQGKLPIQIIHRDPNFSNILFLEKTVNGFIDFDLSEKNIRLFDPCYCATSILSQMTPSQYDEWPSILAAILQGYDLESPLSQAEKAVGFHVVCAIQLICVAYFEDQENKDETFKRLAAANRNMLTFIIHQQKLIQSIFKEISH